ncbi:conserved domain protein [Haemophilus pittmaniae HK 85]|uniref:Conserved domain protein n=1 Tax=Haemophilus pittmaniae HK 85 TaxID=1035188 RepID=F9Q9L2_9PAST|nr:conserved domain protein [Haemophilus pittmaniae HK 85]
MQSERFVALTTYFESLEKLLPSANEHKTTQDDTAQKSAFLAACALWWEAQGAREDKDEDFPLQIQDIFEGLDSALTKQRARQNPWYPTWRK